MSKNTLPDCPFEPRIVENCPKPIRLYGVRLVGTIEDDELVSKGKFWAVVELDDTPENRLLVVQIRNPANE